MELERKITRILQNNCDTKIELIVSKTLLEDVNDDNEKIRLMKYNHETKTTHRGINDVIKQLNKKYYCPNLSNDGKRYVSLSQTCQILKYDRHPQNVKLQLTPTPSEPLEHIHIDLFFVEEETFMTILDPFSKIGEAYKVESKNAI